MSFTKRAKAKVSDRKSTPQREIQRSDIMMHEVVGINTAFRQTKAGIMHGSSSIIVSSSRQRCLKTSMQQEGLVVDLQIIHLVK